MVATDSSELYRVTWAERFKSVLVEDQPGVVQAVAAYVDLNPVRGTMQDIMAAYQMPNEQVR